MHFQARQKKLQSIFSKPSQSKKPKSLSSAALPNIYTKNVRQKMNEISIEKSNDVRRQICKVITFKKDKVTCLESSLYELIPQQIQAISYNSPEYYQKLKIVNKIFVSCDLQLQERDILVADGLKSQVKYIFITNFSYHPQSLCCQRQIILKCIEKRGIEIQPQHHSKAKWEIMCTGCQKNILRLTQKDKIVEKAEQNYQKKRRLLDFALHIASGRYKKHLLEDDPAILSFQNVKSRFSNAKIKKELHSLN